MARILTTRYPARCHDCGEDIPVGTQVRWFGRGRVSCCGGRAADDDDQNGRGHERENRFQLPEGTDPRIRRVREVSQGMARDTAARDVPQVIHPAAALNATAKDFEGEQVGAYELGEMPPATPVRIEMRDGGYLLTEAQYARGIAYALTESAVGPMMVERIVRLCK